jgi:hypothetical protein
MKHEQDEVAPAPAEAATEVGQAEEELDDLSWAIVKIVGAMIVIGIAVGVMWGK